MILLHYQAGKEDKNGEPFDSPQNTSTPFHTTDEQDAETPKRAATPASPGFAESDTDHDHGTRLEVSSREEIIALYKKQGRTLSRYKTRFSEVRICAKVY